jgi:hypothetical protein
MHMDICAKKEYVCFPNACSIVWHMPFFTDTNLDAKLFTLCCQKLYCSLVYLTLIGTLSS